MNGRDVLGAAKTGSGKTLAYMLPAVELLRKAPFTPKNGTGVLVIAPTRELAQQIHKEAKLFGKCVGVTACSAIGGQLVREQINPIRRGCHIIVGTPGRLIDILTFFVDSVFFTELDKLNNLE